MSKIDDKQIVYINSRERISGTDSDFTFAINLKPGNSFDRITLLQAGIPKSYYSISSGINYFTLTEGARTATITVVPGNYSRTALATALSALLVAGSPNGWTYVVSFPNSGSQCDTGKYTYTVSGNTSQPSFTFDTITFIDEPMGFTQSSIQSLTYTFVANVLVSDVVCNLQPFQTINVHSNCVSNPFCTGINTDILQSIPANIGSAPYSNIGWTCPEFESFSHNLSSSNTSVARFYLRDEDNLAIDLNGVNLQLVVMFWQKNTALKLLSPFIKLCSLYIRSNIKPSEELEEQ